MKSYILVRVSYPSDHQVRDNVVCSKNKPKLLNMRDEYNATLTKQEEKIEMHYEVETVPFVE